MKYATRILVCYCCKYIARLSIESSSTFLVHGQVIIIFVVSVSLFVCLSVCLFICAEFFSAVFGQIWIKLGHMLHVRV